jgi:uncharacterized membrane protein
MNKETAMLEMVDIAFMIVGITSIGLSLYLLIIMKEFRALFIWGVSLAMVEVSLAWMEHDIKWHIVAMMIFFLFVLVIMLVKIKRRIKVLLKRIAQIEEEEKRDHDSV